MSKTISAGSEVDSYCTKCKLDLNHRVIAMEGPAIKRVECLTCRGHHNYRLPKSAAAAGKAKKKTTRRKTAVKASSRTPAPANQRALWEGAIAGRSPGDFTPYRFTELFQVGQLLKHKKFGDGVVSEVLESGKIQVLFDEGAKILIHGKSP